MDLISDRVSLLISQQIYHGDSLIVIIVIMYIITYHSLLPLQRKVMFLVVLVCLFVCLFVCLLVSNITQKVLCLV